MKTTIDIPDSLLAEAKKLASREGMSLKVLLLESLRRVIQERKRKVPFRLPKVTYKGEGLQAHFQGASWEKIRDFTYEGRGG
jgi:hypothetical protein